MLSLVGIGARPGILVELLPAQAGLLSSRIELGRGILGFVGSHRRAGRKETLDSWKAQKILFAGFVCSVSRLMKNGHAEMTSVEKGVDRQIDSQS